LKFFQKQQPPPLDDYLQSEDIVNTIDQHENSLRTDEATQITRLLSGAPSKMRRFSLQDSDAMQRKLDGRQSGLEDEDFRFRFLQEKILKLQVWRMEDLSLFLELTDIAQEKMDVYAR